MAGLPLIAFAALLALGYAVLMGDVGRIGIGIAAIGFMLALILTGAHIAVVLILLSFLGIWLIRKSHGGGALARVGRRRGDQSLSFRRGAALRAHGLVVDAANIGRDAYRVAAWMLQRIKGGWHGVTLATIGGMMAAQKLMDEGSVTWLDMDPNCVTFAAGP